MKRAMIGVTLLCAIFFAGATAAWADTASYTNPVLGYTLTYPDDMQVIPAWKISVPYSAIRNVR